MLKNFIVSFFTILIFGSAFSQYPGNGNDWVELNQTYYQFSIIEDGIYRLTKADLLTAGLSSDELVGDHIKMIRNGVQVSLYVTTSGLFGDEDYIEFYGKMNRGEMDTPLYSSPLQQPGLTKSLFSDQSIHFLTIDSSGGHQRISDFTNDLSNLPNKEDFHIARNTFVPTSHRKGKHLKINGSSLYESVFDDTEGYNQTIRVNRALNTNFNISNIYPTTEVDAIVTFKLTSVVDNEYVSAPGQVSISLGSSTQTLNLQGKFEYEEFQLSYGVSELTNSKFKITNNTPKGLYIPERSIEFPRDFNYSSTSFGTIDLRKSGERYFELENLPGTEVVLYDLSTNERIIETVSSITGIKTSSSSATNHFVFDTEILSPTFVTEVTYDDLTTGGFNYLVITHPAMEELAEGENYVEKFISYRSSPEGGAWNMKKVYINEIIDQYAYGIEGHSAAIKNYILELNDLGRLPTHVLLIGKGYEYNLTLTTNPVDDYIPVFGSPGSDTQFVSEYGSTYFLTSIGRISARTPTELKNYIDKVIEYEAYVSNTSDDAQTKEKLWMKNAMNLAGGINDSQNNYFANVLNSYADKYEQSNIGGVTTSYLKVDTFANEDLPSIEEKINSGVGLINYFGHSIISALEYDITDFNEYDQNGRYPFMLTNGCYVGDLFQERYSLSEDFVLAKDAGVMIFLGPTQLGISSGMQLFCSNMYDQFVIDDYGTSIGEAIVQSQNEITSTSWVYTFTKQQLVFHGDPALQMFYHEKPDYLVELGDVEVLSTAITPDQESLKVKATISNIGRAVNEPVLIRLTRTLPNGETQVYNQTVDNIHYQKEVIFTIPSQVHLTQGSNSFMVEIDPEEEIDEITKANNNLLTPVEKESTLNTITPVFPVQFAITDDTTLSLKAYASLFTADENSYHFEIDITEEFNTPSLETASIVSKGGVVEWKPTVSWQDEQVYYWRVKKEGGDWANSSFVFSDLISTGWNQSDYYQFLKDDLQKINLAEDENFYFEDNNKTLYIKTSTGNTISDFQIAFSLDGEVKGRKSCGSDVMVAIIDQMTGEVIPNQDQGGGVGLYNSDFCNNSSGINAYHFNLSTGPERKNFMDMFDLIEEGHYVAVFTTKPLNPVANDWASDLTTYGTTIFDKLIEKGATKTHLITEDSPYIFFFQQGNVAFAQTLDVVGADAQSVLAESIEIPTNFYASNINSPLIGPAASWGSFVLEWNSELDDDTTGDAVTYSIIGYNNGLEETILFENLVDLNLDLSSIDASVYPYISIQLNVKDDVKHTAPQIEMLRVLYTGLPDLAIDITGLVESMPLSFEQFEVVDLTYSLSNITNVDMNDVQVRYNYNEDITGSFTITGNLNNNEFITQETYDGLVGQEEREVQFTLRTEDLGNNYLVIDANPDNLLPEQYHFNNVALVEFEVTETLLPIELGVFAVEPEDNDAVLHWTTLSETNNSHFEVERSLDGINFDYVENITSQSVNGFSDTEVEYTYNDKNAAYLADKIFYRLKQVDLQDSGFTYSPVRIVEFDLSSLETMLFPNPVVGGDEPIVIQSGKAMENIKIFNASGELMIEQSLMDVRATSIDVSQLAGGTYVVLINNEKQLKFIKQ